VNVLLWAILAIVGAFGIGFLLGCTVMVTRGCWHDLRKTDWLWTEN